MVKVWPITMFYLVSIFYRSLVPAVYNQSLLFAAAMRKPWEFFAYYTLLARIKPAQTVKLLVECSDWGCR